MEYEKMKSAVNAIVMPDEKKRRITRTCKMAAIQPRKEIIMNHKIRKPVAVCAVMVVCLALSVTALAATGALQGFFKDITDFRGAVIGTSYEQATDEIGVTAVLKDNTLTVLAAFENPQEAPYSEMEEMDISHYQIIDSEGNVVKEGETKQQAPVVDGQAAIDIALEDMEYGNYKLLVTALVAAKKADQPLNISGVWECLFTK